MVLCLVEVLSTSGPAVQGLGSTQGIEALAEALRSRAQLDECISTGVWKQDLSLNSDPQGGHLPPEKFDHMARERPWGEKVPSDRLSVLSVFLSPFYTSCFTWSPL